MNIYDPLPMWLQLIESFSFDFHFSHFWLKNNSDFEKRCHKHFDISLKNMSLWLWHYILIQIAFPFPSQILVCAMAFQLTISFWDRHLQSSLKKKKKMCEEIYRQNSTHVSRPSKTIDQSFMTNLKIYFQQSKYRFLDVGHT